MFCRRCKHTFSTQSIALLTEATIFGNSVAIGARTNTAAFKLKETSCTNVYDDNIIKLNHYKTKEATVLSGQFLLLLLTMYRTILNNAVYISYKKYVYPNKR